MLLQSQVVAVFLKIQENKSQTRNSIFVFRFLKFLQTEFQLPFFSLHFLFFCRFYFTFENGVRFSSFRSMLFLLNDKYKKIILKWALHLHVKIFLIEEKQDI